MYGSTSVAVEEVGKNVILEEQLKNPTTADDIPVKGRVGKRKKKRNKPPRLGGTHHHRPANIKSNQKRMIWKPKSMISSDNGVPTTSDHDRVMSILLPSKKLVEEECDSTQNNSHETTLMIRNIPSKYTREMLMNLLEEHCKEVNEMGETDSEDDIREDERLSAFDFLYLPIDFETGCNKGYAFVNMINSSGAEKLKLFLTGYKWGVYQSKKISKISPAKIQGKEALIKRFENCYFNCESEKLLPLSFSPYLDGFGGFVVESTVGKCCGPRFHRNDADGDCYKPTSE
ncbi:hypothetical protein MKX01_033178 [Papaver californicum]|nr:hypothetical protein MKX01_033178 [Papaver californicum]